jgi:hypothetical protein
MPGDTRTAYLFQCGNEELFAVSPDKAGEVIPRSSCTQGWLLRHEFQLGAQEPVPAPIESEPIIRGINAKGYYIWRVISDGRNHHRPTPRSARLCSSKIREPQHVQNTWRARPVSVILAPNGKEQLLAWV